MFFLYNSTHWWVSRLMKVILLIVHSQRVSRWFLVSDHLRRYRVIGMDSSRHHEVNVRHLPAGAMQGFGTEEIADRSCSRYDIQRRTSLLKARMR